jgi:uncharacterized repeat protein (TIGR03803 family)
MAMNPTVSRFVDRLKNFSAYAVLCFSVMVLVAQLAPAQFTILHTFSGGDGVAPQGGLLWDGQSRLYGITLGDPYYNASLYRVDTDGNNFVVVGRFYSNTGFNNGPNPGLVMDSGYLYGTTQAGGLYGLGTVFRLPVSGIEVTPDDLYSFAGISQQLVTGLVDGADPNGGLVKVGSQLIGTTHSGGPSADGYGTVFSITIPPASALPNSLSESWVYNFGFSDGANPTSSRLIVGKDGNLYGTTPAQGQSGCGTIFQIDPTGSNFKSHSFNGIDGCTPYSDLIMDQAGNLYGTTTESIDVFNNTSHGTVFKVDIATCTDSSNQIDISTCTVTALHYFVGGTNDGAQPYGGLAIDPSGNLYGTTIQGGAFSDPNVQGSGGGTLFKVVPSQNPCCNTTILHSFDVTGAQGTAPQPGGLTIDDSGNLYGAALSADSGTNGTNGVLFKFSLPGYASGSTLPQTITAVDSSGTPQPVTVTFEAVSNGGPVNANPITPLPPGAAAAYDVSTHATYTGNLTVCFSGYLPGTVIDISHNGDPFAPVTVDANGQACITVTSLSPFVLKLHVTDTTPPDLTLPGNITKEATGPNGSIVTFTATATDAVDGIRPITCAPPSGFLFGLGTTTVNCSAVDLSGNTANGSFMVTVHDSTAPNLTLPSNISAEATTQQGAAVPYTVTASDLVNGAITPVCSAASGATFPLGMTTVTCSASDKAGNTATGSFTVTVHDTTPPTITVPANITVAATGPNGAVVTYSVSATDLVSAPITPVCAPASGSTFPVGTKTVSCSATDGASNTSMRTFNVTVTSSSTTEPPLNVLNAVLAVTHFSQPNSDLLGATLNVQLGAGNDGVNLGADLFHFAVAGGTVALSVDVPLASFKRLSDGSLAFAGTVSGLPTTVALKPSSGGKYSIVLGLTKANLGGFTNPAMVQIALGNDIGSITTTAIILKK